MLKTIHIPINHLFPYLPTYLYRSYFLWDGTKVKSDINSVNVHPQLDHKGHPMDGATC
jgi:hypothetical protein